WSSDVCSSDLVGSRSRPSARARQQRAAAAPAGWDAIETRLGASGNAEVRTLVQTLSLTFGSQRALLALRQTLGDATAPLAVRRAALDALAGAKDLALPPVLQGLLNHPDLGGAALRALAA